MQMVNPSFNTNYLLIMEKILQFSLTYGVALAAPSYVPGGYHVLGQMSLYGTDQST